MSYSVRRISRVGLSSGARCLTEIGPSPCRDDRSGASARGHRPHRHGVVRCVGDPTWVPPDGAGSGVARSNGSDRYRPCPGADDPGTDPGSQWCRPGRQPTRKETSPPTCLGTRARSTSKRSTESPMTVGTRRSMSSGRPLSSGPSNESSAECPAKRPSCETVPASFANENGYATQSSAATYGSPSMSARSDWRRLRC